MGRIEDPFAPPHGGCTAFAALLLVDRHIGVDVTPVLRTLIVHTLIEPKLAIPGSCVAHSS